MVSLPGLTTIEGWSSVRPLSSAVPVRLSRSRHHPTDGVRGGISKTGRNEHEANGHAEENHKSDAISCFLPAFTISDA